MTFIGEGDGWGGVCVCVGVGGGCVCVCKGEAMYVCVCAPFTDYTEKLPVSLQYTWTNMAMTKLKWKQVL